jgi:RimJ/RimL family protein N-acetyltransferase
MWLTVHPENHPAQRLYASAGFADTGEQRDDEPIWKLVFE